jgi:D-tyrosyl-tRNA(Tyr) deacylase
VPSLRIFEDAAGKMNRSLLDERGALLAVSQFTLFADTSRGRRPSFTGAMPPGEAQRLYALFCERCRAQGLVVEEGVFAADMRVALVNAGPVTITLDSRGSP